MHIEGNPKVVLFSVFNCDIAGENWKYTRIYIFRSKLLSLLLDIKEYAAQT